MSAEQLKIAVKALEDVSNWTFGWDGDCGVTRCADEALSAIEAIAPPVAAGSVDTPTWTSEAISCAYLPGAKQFVELEIHQQLVADALARQIAVFKKAGDVDQAEFNRKWTEQKERAEKAEADLKQVNEWRNAALEENMQSGERWAKRVADLEAQLAAAKPSDLKA